MSDDKGGNDGLKLRHRLLLRLIHPLQFLQRGMTLGVRAACFNAKGEVFLVRHTYVPGWYLPGGGVEGDEDAAASLARELVEEGNIALSAEPDLFGLYAHAPRSHVAVYVARAFTQSAPKAPDWEIAEAGFFPLDALPDNSTRATRARIAEFRGLAPKSRRW